MSQAPRAAKLDEKRELIVDQLRRVLSEEIVTGVLGPGVRLDEQSLADRFQVSRTPVREVLSQLSVLGLVERRPHRGVVVLQQSQERLLQLFEVMAELEGACARFAAERMSPEEKALLTAVHAQAAAVAEAEDATAYDELNTRFHRLIYDGTHNSALVELALDARRRVFHFRHAQFRIVNRVRNSHEEHCRVVTAILAGDGAGAYEAMKAHILTVKDVSSAMVSRPPVRSVS
ncbi:GntR family transcriptional regulator [Xanthobacter variabilis]|uniref:GntR family transcriptional regulator n=1 Tax=Xanthobacter variabilis TaxID=3119932 RepID=UPI00372989E5